MRQPARQIVRQQQAQTISYPAPIGGWNSVKPLSAMEPTEAVVMDNFFPRPAYCELRGGSSSFATGMTGNGKTLAVYNGITGINKMFCATASGVFNVSAAGAVGAAVAARTDGKHQWKMFGDGTNNYLIMLNGVDKPLYYDGTTWLAVDGATSPALTGIATTELIGVAVHKSRLIFIAKNSLAWWYLSAGVAGGALTKFDLSGVAQKGGYIMAADTWTVDAGNGPDDRLVFITSEGELIVYAGTNPSSSTSWGLVGTYRIGKPLGRKCMIKIGSDMIILTQNGAYPLSVILQDTGINYANAYTVKIQPSFLDAAQKYGTNYGWSSTVYPLESAVLVNVPVAEDGLHYQYVINTQNQSWCRFVGWNAEDFVVFNDVLYFCKGTSVYKAWTGKNDDGANITGYIKTAFSYFGAPGQLKKFKLYRPVFSTSGAIPILSDMDVDFNDVQLVGSASIVPTPASLYDSAKYDTALYGGSDIIEATWISPSCFDGFAGAAKMQINTNSFDVKLMSIDYLLETGGVL